MSLPSKYHLILLLKCTFFCLDPFSVDQNRMNAPGHIHQEMHVIGLQSVHNFKNFCVFWYQGAIFKESRIKEFKHQ
jgi:hypothetical protein